MQFIVGLQDLNAKSLRVETLVLLLSIVLLQVYIETYFTDTYKLVELGFPNC